METESHLDNDGTQLEPLEDLPEILAVVEGRLSVATDDDFVGLTAARGFEYLLSREFARQQPALSLLYDLEFVLTGPRLGSRHYDFKILFKLKKRVKGAVRKAGAITMITLALSIPSATLSTFQLIDYLFPPVQIQLNSDMPNAPVTIELREVSRPDSTNVFPKGGGHFEF